MSLPPLVRRRALWLPTAWGWALLGALGAGGLALLAFGLYPFLAPRAPIGGGLLVVEGWVGERTLEAARDVWRSQAYALVATTGGPIDRGSSLGSWAGVDDWATLGAQRLRGLGIPAERIAAVPAPASAQDRTFLSAVVLRDWLASRGLGVGRLDVVTEGPHARRTWLLYRLAFGSDAEVGILAVDPAGYDPNAWWRSSAGTRSVVGEALAWAWTRCCFEPPARGSPAERWGDEHAIARWRARTHPR